MTNITIIVNIQLKNSNSHDNGSLEKQRLRIWEVVWPSCHSSSKGQSLRLTESCKDLTYLSYSSFLSKVVLFFFTSLSCSSCFMNSCFRSFSCSVCSNTNMHTILWRGLVLVCSMNFNSMRVCVWEREIQWPLLARQGWTPTFQPLDFCHLGCDITLQLHLYRRERKKNKLEIVPPEGKLKSVQELPCLVIDD